MKFTLQQIYYEIISKVIKIIFDYKFLTDRLFKIINENKNSQLMKYNIVDINNSLILNSSSSQSSLNVVVKAKSKQMIQTYMSRQSRSSSSANLLKKQYPRQNSTKDNKKKRSIYEIVDNKKIIIYRKGGANSFIFNSINQSKNKFEYLCDHFLFKRRSYLQQNKPICKLLIAQNYNNYDPYQLLQFVGKRLIFQGMSFSLAIQLQSENVLHNMQSQKTIQNIYSFKQDQNQPVLLHRKIKFVTQLKQYISSIKSQRQNISKLWFFNSSFQLGISFCKKYREGIIIQILEQLAKDHSALTNQTNPNFNILISLLSDIPTQNNVDLCKQLFQQCLVMKQQIIRYAENHKQLLQNRQSLHPLNFNQRHKKNSKYDQIKTRKNSKHQIQRSKKDKKQNYNILNQRTKITSKYQKDKNQTSLSSQNSDQSRQTDRISQDIRKFPNHNNDISVILAENINLKWQLQTMQKQYQLQSLKFMEKTNKKYDALREQRTFCLQQNGRLRKDNQDLLIEVSQLKKAFQLQMNKRIGQRISIQQTNSQIKNKALMLSEDKVKKLEQQVKRLSQTNLQLNTQLKQTKSKLEDSRRRNRERIEQLHQEMLKYKNFSEQLKLAYDQRESKTRLDKIHCQNLQQRCRKYQQSLSDLLKMKIKVSDSQKEEQDYDFNLQNQKQIKNARNSEEYQSQEFNTNLKSQRSASLSVQQQKRIKNAMHKQLSEQSNESIFKDTARQKNQIKITKDKIRQQVQLRSTRK